MTEAHESTASRQGSAASIVGLGQYDSAVDEVRRHNYDCRDFRLLFVKRHYLGGELVGIGFTGPDNNKDLMNYVFLHGSEMELYRNERLLIDSFGNRQKAGVLQTILKSDSVPGIIAIIVLLCIVGLIIHDPSAPKVPDVLSSALALILGFYFGKQSGR